MTYDGIDIAAIAFVVLEDQEVRQTLTHDEIDQLRAELVDCILELDKLTDEYSDVKADFKTQIDAAKKKVADPKRLVRNGYRLVKTTLYGVQNFESGMMEFLTAEGDVISSRKLYPAERQQKLTLMQGTDDNGK